MPCEMKSGQELSKVKSIARRMVLGSGNPSPKKEGINNLTTCIDRIPKMWIYMSDSNRKNGNGQTQHSMP